MLDPIQIVLCVTGATDGTFFGQPMSLRPSFLATVDFQQEGWAAMTQLGNTDVAESCNASLRLGDSLYLAGTGRHWNETCWVNCGIRELSKQPYME
jgi:hypothetical protein